MTLSRLPALNVKVMEIQTSVAASEMWLRDDLDEVYALLFRFLGNGFRMALCSVGWLTTQKFAILVPDPIVFAPWSALLDCTASFESPVNTHLTMLPSQGGQQRTSKSDVYQQPIAGLTLLALCCTQSECGLSPLDVVLCSLLSHALSQVHRWGDLGDEVESKKGIYDSLKVTSPECQSNGNLKQAWVNGGRGHDSLKLASALNFQRDGNSNTRCSC